MRQYGVIMSYIIILMYNKFDHKFFSNGMYVSGIRILRKYLLTMCNKYTKEC